MSEAQPEVDVTDETVAEVKKTVKEYNDDRKRDKLVRQATRAHEWRVQVWAQSELKIRSANAEIEVLGGDPVEVWEPDFTDNEALRHYASMTLTK